MNIYSKTTISSGIAAIFTVLAGISAVQAAEDMVLIYDQSRVVTLGEQPYTVVVGNPAIADVTTDGSSIFFHPKSFGLTNVLVTDVNGKTLGDYLVRVIYEDKYSVSMYSPGSRETFSCKNDCEPTLRIGDGSGFFGNSQRQATDKNGLASGQALGEDLLLQSQQNSGYAAR